MRLPLVGLPTNAAFAPLDAAQEEAPLVHALAEATSRVRAPFFFPGHKMGAGAPRLLSSLLPLRRALRHDLPELPELDNLFAPEGAIMHAQELAASAFSAERTWFLVNGSTAGVIAAGMWRRPRIYRALPCHM